uniref:Uncharacterized protein n=1 Tax=Triticum urartu TaxID=4572 RepID=A0A8R7TQ56_TRIUA
MDQCNPSGILRLPPPPAVHLFRPTWPCQEVIKQRWIIHKNHKVVQDPGV